MGTLILTATVLAAVFGATSCGPESQIVHEFCHDILLQTTTDANQCLHKTDSYTITGKASKAALIYMCCLGYFKDVTHYYKKYLSSLFDQFLASMSTNKDVKNIGYFVMMCKNENRTLNPADFNFWCSNGQTAQVCFSR
ncbi:hypothetical protein BsWGS_15042 [Bradybaena similaris]